MQPFPAEGARTVGPDERCDDHVAGVECADVGADGLDGADELVPHTAAGLVALHRLVRPEIAAADRGAGDGDEGVGRLDQAGIRDGLDADVTGAVHHSCAISYLPSVLPGAAPYSSSVT